MQGIEANKPLAGLCIWVTRPSHQSQSLLNTLTALGADTISVPLLAIEAVDNPQNQARLQHLEDYQLIVFVSANAVQYATGYLKKRAHKAEISAIGSATAEKCRENGVNVQHFPDQADSDGLLALPRFQAVDGQRVLIIRGVGGRAYLGQQLAQRGAQVEYAEVYRRILPAIQLNSDFARADVILVTSSEALTHLASLASRDKQEWIFSRQSLVIHQRIAGRANELGFTLKPLVARHANDDGMVTALVEWAQFRRSE